MVDMNVLIAQAAAKLPGQAKYVGTELPLAANADKVKTGWDGLAQLTAGQLVRPSPKKLIESASIWTAFSVLDRKVRLFKPGERRTINYVQSPLTLTPALTLSRKLHSTAVGYADLPKGEWLINIPIVTAEGTEVEFVFQDTALGNQYDVDSSIGNIPGSGVPSVGDLSDTEAIANSNVTVAVAASTVICDFDATRIRQVLCNTDTVNTIWLKFRRTNNPTAIIGRGIFLGPLEKLLINDPDWAKMACSGIAAVADCIVSSELWRPA